jgi:hypothetical protein
MNGVNIREIQTLLGHQNVETTMIYTHVMRDMTTAPKSPLDLLLEGTPKSAEPPRHPLREPSGIELSSNSTE